MLVPDNIITLGAVNIYAIALINRKNRPLVHLATTSYYITSLCVTCLSESREYDTMQSIEDWLTTIRLNIYTPIKYIPLLATEELNNLEGARIIIGKSMRLQLEIPENILQRIWYYTVPSTEEVLSLPRN